jgi:hypothetical protein
VKKIKKNFFNFRNRSSSADNSIPFISTTLVAAAAAAAAAAGGPVASKDVNLAASSFSFLPPPSRPSGNVLSSFSQKHIRNKSLPAANGS